jgi:hypothetical protein
LSSYYDPKPAKPERDAKTVPGHIERHVFAETRLTAYRLNPLPDGPVAARQSQFDPDGSRRGDEVTKYDGQHGADDDQPTPT